MSSLILFAQAYDGARVGEGVLRGGWEYIWGGYALSAFFLVAYGISLYVRRPRSTP